MHLQSCVFDTEYDPGTSPLTRFCAIPIDLAFVNKYANGEAPHLNSGDMIFVVLAKVDGHDLITEDHAMLREAKRLGVAAYRIEESLNKAV